MKTLPQPIALNKMTISELRDELKQVSDEMSDRRHQRAQLTGHTPHGRDLIRHHSSRIYALAKRHQNVRLELHSRGERVPGL